MTYNYGQPQQQQQGPGFYQQSGTYLPPQSGGGQQLQQQLQQQVPILTSAMLPLEQSYIENILRLNKGKLATVYMTFDKINPNKIFKGIIEAAGRDHIILSDPTNGIRYLLLMVYLDYITFNEEINYIPPKNPFTQQQPMAPPYTSR